MSRNKGIGGLLKSVNDASRTVNNVQRATQSVKRTVGGGSKQSSKQSKQSAQAKDSSWLCECGITSTTKFCGGCGKPAPSVLVCPKCKWKRPLENNSQKFCGNCGNQLEQ